MIQRTRAGGDEIDVGEELERQQVEGERGAADVEARRSRLPGARPFLLVTGAVVLLVGGYATYEAVKHSGDARIAAEQKEKSQLVANKLPAIKASRSPSPVDGSQVAVDGTTATVPALTAAPIVPTDGAAIATVPPPSATAVTPKPTKRELLLTRRLGGGFGADAGGSSGGRVVADTSQAGPGPNGTADPESFQARLQPVKLASSRAGKLGNREFLITKGTMIDCGLGTRLDSSVPGLVSCYVTRDVWSDAGHVILIPRNSFITGSYSKGVALGQHRLFVSWDRLKTPEGVIIDIDSPGTDALGGAGLPGKVDSHFWARYGGAVMLSVLTDVLQAGIAVAGNAVQSAGTTNLNTTSQTSSSLATTALQQSLGIAPTLLKNQGDRVNIFVARDLDFSGIYVLKPGE